MDLSRSTIRTAIVVVAVVAALGASAILAPLAWDDATGPDGTVGVVTLEGPIGPQSADSVIEDLREARTNESIDAVVLRVNSPGGAVGASESLYLAGKQTAAEKPLVTNVAGSAASGGYMALLGSDYVYTTPSSNIGSVGVYGTLPPAQISDVDNAVTSAPTKGSAGTEAEVRRKIDRMKQTFVGLVMDERGSNLTVDRGTVARAKVYTGSRAVELGFADEIGGRQAAVQAAAERADIDDYRVVSLGSDNQSLGSLFANGNVDRTRYFALHGFPDSASVTPIEAISADATNTTSDATAVAVGGESG
ncbi:MAG: protease-4 [Haloarculaceae archaeon]|jgi:protease-4